MYKQIKERQEFENNGKPKKAKDVENSNIQELQLGETLKTKSI